MNIFGKVGSIKMIVLKRKNKIRKNQKRIEHISDNERKIETLI